MRERAVGLVRDIAEDAGSVTAACRRIGEQLGINTDTLRGWVKHDTEGDSVVDLGQESCQRKPLATPDAVRITRADDHDIWLPSDSHQPAKSSRLAGIPGMLTIHSLEPGLLSVSPRVLARS